MGRSIVRSSAGARRCPHQCFLPGTSGPAGDQPGSKYSVAAVFLRLEVKTTSGSKSLDTAAASPYDADGPVWDMYLGAISRCLEVPLSVLLSSLSVWLSSALVRIYKAANSILLLLCMYSRRAVRALDSFNEVPFDLETHRPCWLQQLAGTMMKAVRPCNPLSWGPGTGTAPLGLRRGQGHVSDASLHPHDGSRGGRHALPQNAGPPSRFPDGRTPTSIVLYPFPPHPRTLLPRPASAHHRPPCRRDQARLLGPVPVRRSLTNESPRTTWF